MIRSHANVIERYDSCSVHDGEVVMGAVFWYGSECFGDLMRVGKDVSVECDG